MSTTEKPVTAQLLVGGAVFDIILGAEPPGSAISVVSKDGMCAITAAQPVNGTNVIAVVGMNAEQRHALIAALQKADEA